MKAIRFRFNDWEAFERCVEEIITLYGHYVIYGEVQVPEYHKFEGYPAFLEVVQRLREMEPPGTLHIMNVYGEVWIKIR